jgi:large subunit ribosomal protein L21
MIFSKIEKNIFLFRKNALPLPAEKNRYLDKITMYAIVEIAGQQFKVNKDQKIFVHRQEGEVGDKLSFDKVYLIDNESDVKVGTPVVEGASVDTSILAHVRGDKVLVFKKKRRKGYQKLTGHRQDFTQLLVENITI